MRKFLLLFIFLLFRILTIDGQIPITGKVIDEHFKPIAFANVMLLNSSDSSFIQGTITKDDGAFNIQTLENEGLLKITSVGYKDLYVDSVRTYMGDIQLQPDEQMLAEVVVKGHRQIIRQDHEKTIFNVNQMSHVEALTAMDVMKFAPGVVVTTNGIINVAGKDAVVFVNDRRLSEDELSAYLNNLRASDIQRIEVMQNHGGDKDASIQGGVINIVTKRNVLGFNGSIGFYTASPKKEYYDYSPSANVFFGTTKWNLYGTYSYSQGRNSQYSETVNNYLYNSTNHFSSGNYIYHEKKHIYRFGAVYNLHERHSVGFEVNGISTSPTTDMGEYNSTYGIKSVSYTGRTFQNYKFHSDFYNIVGSYRWNLDNNRSYLRFLLNYNKKNSKSENGLKTTYQDLRDYNIDEEDLTASDGNNVTSKIDFRKNFSKGWGIRAGGKMLVSKRSSNYSSFDNLLHKPSFTDWSYRENIYGGYIGAFKEIGQLYINGSLQLENTDINGKIYGGNYISKDYTDWFPYLYLSYNTNRKYNYSLSYSRTIYRPAFSLMNGYVNRVSDVLYDRGNPDLEAELTDVLDFTLSHGKHSASLIYRHKLKAITELYEVEDGITYHTNVNFGSISSVTINYSYSGNLLNWWQSNLYLACSYTHIPKSYNKTHQLGSLISWNNRMTWEKVGIFTMGFYSTSPTIVGNSYQKGFSTVDFSIERSFLKNIITVQLGVNDLFNNSKVRASNRVPTLNYDVYLKDQTRQVWLRLTFNFSTKTKSNQNRIQNDNGIRDRL